MVVDKYLMDSIKKYVGTERRITKEEQTCAFHKDVEDKQNCMKTRIDRIYYLLIVVIALTTPEKLITYWRLLF